MISRSYCDIKKYILCLLILSGLAVSLYAQDTQIHDVINVYKRVVTIGPDYVILNNVDSIFPGDTVMLIQMQGVGISTIEGGYGVGVQQKFGEPGGYEFLLVQDTVKSTNKVVFRNNILNAFNAIGNIQLIKVPYFNSARVTGKLSARPWNPAEKVGGVLAMIVGRKLTLNADIDVS